MAIVQISRITNRKGLTENLPQLAGAELGWCVDSRRLFIGNGTLPDGAPIIGNTEILTEFSDITVLSDYTYVDIAVGYAAQTGPTTSDPVIRTVQEKLDDFANIRDFGAVGDGTTDDTLAINRALFQLYCIDANPLVRRSLYFPAGTYRITETIVIPTYAKLIGEGANCTTIFLDTSADISTLNAYVARYGDSLQQTGVNIGTNGAVAPRNIEISSLTFQSVEQTDIFLVENAEQCWFDSVNFIGPLTASDITAPTLDISAVRFASTPSLICNQITFDKCGFENMIYAISTTAVSQSITISNSRFTTLYQGISLDGNGPTGFRVVHNYFDSIYAEGISFQDVDLNASAYNLFLNVGNSIASTSPTSPCIAFGNNNNLSVGDMFERSDADNLIEPRITVSNNTSTSGGTLTQLGRYAREAGRTFTLINNQSSVQSIFDINALDTKAFSVDYTIVRSDSIRHGKFVVVDDSALATAVYNDDFSENSSTGITLSASKSGNTITVNYISSNTGFAGTLTYSISRLA